MHSIERFSGFYRFLSNFYPSNISYEGIKYCTVEHAFQASKTLDPERRMAISIAPTPHMAKLMGRSIILRKDWENIKRRVMYDLLWLKFNQSFFKEKLLDTGQAILIEGNTWNDTYWGVCDGVGQNHLGKTLMIIREELQHAVV